MIKFKLGEEEKLFSRPDFILGTSHSIGIVQQLVKLINIREGQDCERNLQHWIISGLQNVYLKNSISEVKKFQLVGGYQGLFILNEEPDELKQKAIDKIFGTELNNRVTAGELLCGNSFIIEGIKRAQGREGAKYKKYFTNLEKDKDFIQSIRDLIHFISLCISEQANTNDNYYRTINRNIKVDYLRSNKYTEIDLRKIIIQCLLNYFESNGLSYSEKFKDYI